MKFRITKIYLKDRALPSSDTGARAHKCLRARRSEYYREAIVKSADRAGEEIRFSSLFEFAELDAPQGQKRKILIRSLRRLRAFASSIGMAVLKAARSIGKAVGAAIRRLTPRSRPRSIPLLLGALCSAATITLVSALILGAALLIRYFLPYEEFVIPDLVGCSCSDAESLYSDSVDFDITYAYSAYHEEGTVIGQYPSGGVVKKQYGSSPSTVISLKVSRGAKALKTDGLVGMSERDALITLKKNEIITKIIKKHSDTVKAGVIISTSPATASVKEGDTLTLTVSLGKRITYVSVPDLYGLTESGACSALKERGFRIGSISYEASSLPFGRVISQSPAPFAELEQGAEIGFSVSAGEKFSSRLVPELYGYTSVQAEQALKTAGLVIGNVYAVSSGAPSGTVVAQFPPPSSPITSSITSVDLYISS